MELNSENVSYNVIKNQLKIQEQIAKIKETNIRRITEDIEILKGEIINYKRIGDINNAELKTQELKAKQKLIENEKKSLEEVKKVCVGLKEKIDEQLKNLMQDPSLKRHVEEVINTRYDRKLKTLEKSKTTTKTLLDLVTNHPNIRKDFAVIMGTTSDIKKKEQEIANLKYTMQAGPNGAMVKVYADPNLKSKLESELTKLKDTNKKAISRVMNYVTKHNLKISKEEIIENTDVKYSKTMDGKADVIKTFEKSIKMDQKQIDTINAAKEQLGIDVIKEEEMQKSWWEKRKEQRQAEKNALATTKLKWWNFIKKAKVKKQARMDAKEAAEKESEKKKGEFLRSNENEYKNSLRYDVVKDATDKIMRDNLREGKKIIKEDNRDR